MVPNKVKSAVKFVQKWNLIPLVLESNFGDNPSGGLEITNKDKELLAGPLKYPIKKTPKSTLKTLEQDRHICSKPKAIKIEILCVFKVTLK